MSASRILPLPVLACLCWGCATTAPQPAKGTFVFENDGKSYEIISMIVHTGEGYNYLVRRDDERIVMRARDNDQDGILDTLLAGDLTLARANEIYAQGIDEARSKGKYKVNQPARMYELHSPEGTFAIQTCLVDPNKAYNRFVVFGPNAEYQVTALDTDADGTLDKIEKGVGVLEKLQRHYTITLDNALQQGRIERVDGKFIVTSRELVKSIVKL